MLLLYSVRESTYVRLEVRRTDKSFSFFSFFLVFLVFFVLNDSNVRHDVPATNVCKRTNSDCRVAKIGDTVVPFVAEIGDNGKCVPIFNETHRLTTDDLLTN